MAEDRPIPIWGVALIVLAIAMGTVALALLGADHG
jgi:hypothetical protein